MFAPADYPRRLLPDIHVNSILDINFAQLAQRGLIYGIFDLDNTLVSRKANTVSSEILSHLWSARAAGYLREMVIVSNVAVDKKWIVLGQSRVARVRKIADQLECPFIVCMWPNPLKPHPQPFQDALAQLKTGTDNTFVVGDQLLTDIRGAKHRDLGLYAILVKPIGSDWWLTKFRRNRERAILSFYQRAEAFKQRSRVG